MLLLSIGYLTVQMWYWYPIRAADLTQLFICKKIHISYIIKAQINQTTKRKGKKESFVLFLVLSYQSSSSSSLPFVFLSFSFSSPLSFSLPLCFCEREIVGDGRERDDEMRLE